MLDCNPSNRKSEARKKSGIRWQGTGSNSGGLPLINVITILHACMRACVHVSVCALLICALIDYWNTDRFFHLFLPDWNETKSENKGRSKVSKATCWNSYFFPVIRAIIEFFA